MHASTSPTSGPKLPATAHEPRAPYPPPQSRSTAPVAREREGDIDSGQRSGAFDSAPYDDARSRVVRLLVRTRGRYALRSAANSGDPSVHQYRERARTTDIAPSAHGHSALALSDPLGNSVPAHRYRSNASRRESLTIWNDHHIASCATPLTLRPTLAAATLTHRGWHVRGAEQRGATRFVKACGSFAEPTSASGYSLRSRPSWP
ncbi:hypothetical protein OH76DRAFT_1419188 [Lentinus brumalis]|uniref:Uncharacterized protein n=1 Tax=Lentinus brumalis TaxID=2498619 RepID=A0A371D6T9_9APHY|nr:hypothetical protein OH76DRAFT_1419188 [Polyporus brumalis]